MAKKYINKTALKKEIGQRFKAFRNFIKKTQNELAEELQVDISTICSIEQGISFPKINLQNYLNRQYHLNLNWLSYGSEEMILPPGKGVNGDGLSCLIIDMDENDPQYEQYVELITLMGLPEIKQIILAKLAEIKILFKDEIKSFLENS